ncbi:MAG: cyclase [Chloroflexi bacterium]|nr:cyclase [Chloroflexota bacterium]
MATLFVHHQVADYAAWRQVYDEFQPTASGLGVTSGTVYVAADDPNDVTVMHDFLTVGAAQAFAANEALHAAIARSGVVGAPTVWVTSKV